MTASANEPAARPTNANLQAQIAEVHDCIHNVGDRVDALAEVVQKDRTASKQRDQVLTKSMDLTRTEMAALSAQVAAADARVEMLVKFFGLRTPDPGSAPAKARITLGSLEWWQVILGIFGTLASWKYVIPAIESGLKAFYHAVMATS